MKNPVQQHESLDALGKKGTCIEFFSAYQDLDLDRMLQLCDEDGDITFLPLGDAFKGKINVVGKGLWAAIMDSFPNLDNTVRHQTFNETNNTVTCNVVIFGTQEKDFANVPTKGNGFDSDHIFIFRFNDKGKITNITVDWDHESFVNQLTK
ncbi:MAG: nuclear transport factor 2 family protein [Bacteroidota bacterium]